MEDEDGGWTEAVGERRKKGEAVAGSDDERKGAVAWDGPTGRGGSRALPRGRRREGHAEWCGWMRA